MNKSKYKIDVEIYIVFIVVIGVSVLNAIFSTIKISNSQESAKEMLSVEIPSLQKFEELNLLITQSVMYTTNWVYLPSNPEYNKKKLRIIIESKYPEIKNQISELQRIDKDIPEFDRISKTIVECDELLVQEKKIMSILADFDDYENPEKHFNAEEIMASKISPQSSALISKFNEIILIKKQRVDELHSEMDAASRSLLLNIQGISLLIVLVILIAVVYLSRKIIVPVMRLRNYILQMGKGEIPDIKIKHSNNAIGQMIEAARSLTFSLKETTYFANKIGYGNLSAEFEPLSEKDELRNALLQMRDSLRAADEENKRHAWGTYCKEKLNEVLRNHSDDINTLSDAVISVVVKILNGYQGGIYLIEEDKKSTGKQNIVMFGSYAMDGYTKGKPFLKKDEGLIGQVIKDGELIYLRNVYNHKKLIYSGFSSFSPSHVLIIPLIYQGDVFGAIELSGFTEFREFEIEYIKNIGDIIGSTIINVRANTLTKSLLKESQELAEKLVAQEEETRLTNAELSLQSQRLKASEEELLQSNLELKIKARELQQKNEINEQARQALMEKASELEESNKYKSEFLANMSHELRTPLNSVLILAKLLEENKYNNLTEKQIEYASVIQKSGRDLLMLINDILDLSKIEAGKIEIIPEETEISWVAKDMRLLFEEIANEKKIEFKVDVESELPESLVTDKTRLEQVVKNLLSNAFKFTSNGGKVSFNIKRPDSDVVFKNKNLQQAKSVIEFSVTDNGIGIAKDKQEIIFEAFQQADGAINKKYGGTGLGLSISKMLVAMLGGEIGLTSQRGKGSTFYLFLPEQFIFNDNFNVPSSDQTLSTAIPDEEILPDHEVLFVSDDRHTLKKGDKSILIIENDPGFAQTLLDMAHQRNLKGIVAADGKEGLQYAKEYFPSAIILEMRLPVMNGWSVLDSIKSDKDLNRIPVHVISSVDKSRVGIDMGASAYLKKPLDKRDLDDAFQSIDRSISFECRHVLLVEDMPIHQEIVKNLLVAQYSNVEIHQAATVAEANDFLYKQSINFIVLDLDLGKGPEEGVSFLEKIKADNRYSEIPVVVFTGHELNEDMEQRIRNLSTKIVNKDGLSFDNLIEESEIFLRSISEQDDKEHLMPAYMSKILNGKTVLLIDDDMRNVYSLSSQLMNENMTVVTACNKKELHERLAILTHIDIVLIDMSMKDIESFEVIKTIRSSDKFGQAPIISITERTHIRDREMSLQAGASDYISKPVYSNQLMSLLRVWLYNE